MVTRAPSKVSPVRGLTTRPSIVPTARVCAMAGTVTVTSDAKAAANQRANERGKVIKRTYDACGGHNGAQAGTTGHREQPTDTLRKRRAIHDKRIDHAAPIRPRALLPHDNQKTFPRLKDYF